LALEFTALPPPDCLDDLDPDLASVPAWSAAELPPRPDRSLSVTFDESDILAAFDSTGNLRRKARDGKKKKKREGQF